MLIDKVYIFFFYSDNICVGKFERNLTRTQSRTIYGERQLKFCCEQDNGQCIKTCSLTLQYVYLLLRNLLLSQSVVNILTRALFYAEEKQLNNASRKVPVHIFGYQTRCSQRFTTLRGIERERIFLY